MTAAAFATARPRTSQRDERAFWAAFDLSLLLVTFIAASDLLINLSPARPVSWLICYGLAALRIWVLWPSMLGMLSRNVVIMVYPAICVASMLWSYAPLPSLVSALQLTMTVMIAAFLGWRYSLLALIKAMAVVMTAGTVLSLVHLVTGIFPWPTHTTAGGLAGFYVHKNMLGQRALFVITAIVGLLLMRRSEVSGTLKLVAVAAMVANLVALGLSLSMTSVLLVPVMAGLVLLLCLRQVPPMVSLTAMGAVLLATALGPLALQLSGIDPVTAVLDGVGKDATMTGRTVLWQIAMDTSRDHPMLGTGYRAFWLAPEFSNGRVLTHNAGARVASSFHNFIVEILVSVGWPGLLAMIAAIWACAVRLGRLVLRDGSVPAAIALALHFGIVVTSVVGTSLFRPHEIMIVLMIAFTVSAGVELDRRRAPVVRP